MRRTFFLSILATVVLSVLVHELRSGHGIAASPLVAHTSHARRELTPGSVQSTDRVQICTPGWATSHRDVPYSRRRLVFQTYGIPWPAHVRFELDHLVPLELGGSNAASNLWPEAWADARRKDGDENRLHAAVCRGALALQTAQRFFVTRYVR